MSNTATKQVSIEMDKLLKAKLLKGNQTLQLNCDMGESYGIWSLGADQQVMPFINQANIACGFHAGDPEVMVKTIQLAMKAGVAIGAHPGYQDKEGFGRRAMVYSASQITHLVRYQVGALSGLCALYGAELSYVKPHGALYNSMMQDVDVFTAIVKALSTGIQNQQNLALMILARPNLTAYQEIAKAHHVELIYEAFADRCYDEQGLLVSRQLPHAVLTDADAIIKQVSLLKNKQGIETHQGKFIPLQVDSICVHGDNEAAITLISTLQQLIND